MATQASEATRIPTGPIAVLRRELAERAPDYAMVLPSHITPDRFQRTVLTAAQSNQALLKCDRRSLLTACMKAAQDNLLPDGREAAIVPFNTRTKIDGEWKWVKLAQYMPMVFGLRKKILQSNEVTDVFAAVVYSQEIKSGRFVYEEGTERCLRHKPILDPSFKPENNDIALAYSVATFANGFKSFEVMRRYEIDEVRQMSQTGATTDDKGEPRDSKGPWVEWFSEMAKKTVIRRHSKSLPQSGDILADVEAEDMAFAARSAQALLGSQAPDAAEDAPEPEPDATEGPESATEEAETATTEPEGEPEPPVDATPVGEAAAETTRAMFERQADDLIGRVKHAELLVDVSMLENEAEDALNAMPVDIAAAVDQAFADARKRLSRRATPEV